LRPLLEIDAEWIGLQQAIGEEDRQALQDMLSAQSIRQLGDELGDFSDTAGLIEQLDAVVSVDSSVAHLAGALGKPVCLMLRKSGEWRWLHGRDESPWYPKHRLFRQQRHGVWNDVVERVAQYLSAINRETAKS
jgi:ADP-heptose:LPS heptosyltransferase